MTAHDNDTFVINGRKSQTFDKSKLKTTSACSKNDTTVKVKKIVGIDEDLADFVEQDTAQRENIEKPLRKRVKSYKEGEVEKKEATWVKPVILGSVILLLFVSYCLFTYFKIKAM